MGIPSEMRNYIEDPALRKTLDVTRIVSAKPAAVEQGCMPRMSVKVTNDESSGEIAHRAWIPSA
jgi:hypothetical protein